MAHVLNDEDVSGGREEGRRGWSEGCRGGRLDKT